MVILATVEDAQRPAIGTAPEATDERLAAYPQERSQHQRSGMRCPVRGGGAHARPPLSQQLLVSRGERAEADAAHKIGKAAGKVAVADKLAGYALDRLPVQLAHP